MFCVRNGVWLAVLFLAAITARPTAAAEEQKAPGERPATEKSVKEKTAAEKPAEKPDPFAVPDGTPRELVEYIEKLRSSYPRDAETRTKTQQAILKATEKILAAKPNDKQREFAVRAKMNMLKGGKKLVEFADELKKGGHKKLARMVRVFTLQVVLRESMLAGPDAMRKSIGEAVKFFAKSSPQPADVGLAFNVGRMAEMTGDSDFALTTYRSLAKAFAGGGNIKIADFTKMLKGVIRRLTLPGHPMKIEGKLLDGQVFDWSKYAGKVVLVDFWATWCGPCVAEIPNMKKCYELYHDKGFEIVGISCDRRLADLEKFVKEKNIPWAIVFGDDDKPSPTVSYYGIMGIPTMILVGKDGKVVSLRARGKKLQEELAKLLGPVEEKKEAKDGEKNSWKDLQKRD